MMTWNSMFFHSPNSILLETVVIMHDYLMMMLLSILVIVMLNMSYNFYSKEFNLEFYENHQIENIWTITPFVLLMFIIFPSLKSLYVLDSCIFCGLTLNITGHQWYWSYLFKDISECEFNSYMTPSETSNLRLLEVDNSLIIPNLMPIRFMVSSMDVLHSWALPSFGVKMDAIPGRLNQFCLSLKRTGVYFGQCSEICGANHSFMPIVVESISSKDFMKMI